MKTKDIVFKKVSKVMGKGQYDEYEVKIPLAVLPEKAQEEIEGISNRGIGSLDTTVDVEGQMVYIYLCGEYEDFEDEDVQLKIPFNLLPDIAQEEIKSNYICYFDAILDTKNQVITLYCNALHGKDIRCC